MASKRKAQQAFGRSREKRGDKQQLFSSNGVSTPQLSAFAAARAAATQTKKGSGSIVTDREKSLVSTIAEAPYDGHHSSRASPDAMSEDDQGDQGDQAVSAATRPEVRMSTISRASVVRDDAAGLELSLRPDESVTFLGEYDLEVLSGVVAVYGALLHPGRGVQRVYAPSVAPLPVIMPYKQNAAIRVTSVESGLQVMENLSPLFRNIGVKDLDTNRSFSLLRTTSDDSLARTLALLEIDEGIKKVHLDSEGLPPRVMAVGPKSSGKSTFNRLLCNMITSRPGKARSRCLYLDLDPGQPEFGPPGQLALVEVTTSILGPAFTHIASTRSTAYRLIRSHTIGATSFKDDPEHYIACAVDLIRHAPKDVPIVVNSCGWVSNLGASTIVSLASKLAITEAVLLEPVDSELAHDLATITGKPAVRIPRRQRQQASRTPAELRAMQTMAYFHQKPSTTTPTKWISKPINSIRPWIVAYAGKEPGVTAILNYSQAPHPDFLGEVLDGSVVAIVVIDDSLVDPDSIQHTTAEALPYLPPKDNTGYTPPLNPRRSHCVGLALVRGIDVETHALQLVTPLRESAIAEEVMDKQIILVRGGFDSPEWAYLEDLYANPDGGGDVGVERPWVSRREQVGIEHSVWRLRHPPMAKDVR